MERFWRKVNKASGVFGATGSYPTECWVWIAHTDKGGYGQFWFRNTMVRAHRVVWIINHGEIEAKKHVLHKCDNPPCVRDDHLFIGVPRDNFNDMSAKGRNFIPRGIQHGMSKLSVEDVRNIRDLYGTGEHSYATLARLYKLDKSQIGHIIRRDHWRDV